MPLGESWTWTVLVDVGSKLGLCSWAQWNTTFLLLLYRNESINLDHEQRWWMVLMLKIRQLLALVLSPLLSPGSLFHNCQLITVTSENTPIPQTDLSWIGLQGMAAGLGLRPLLPIFCQQLHWVRMEISIKLNVHLANSTNSNRLCSRERGSVHN